MCKLIKKTGRKPYGRTPAERDVIKKMRRYRNIHHGKRKSFHEIAKILNTQGIKPPDGQCWYGQSVKNILMRWDGKEIRQRQIKRRNYLDLDQAAHLWKVVCDDAKKGSWRARRRKMIVALLLFGGLRCFELTDLQFRDLPIKHGKKSIVIRQGKRRKYGEIHITKILVELLDQFISDFSDRPKSKLPDTGWLLNNENGRKYSTNQIWQIINRVGRRANLEFLHPHCLRHSYASILQFDSNDQHFVRRQLRHKSSATTDIYIGETFMHIDENTPREIMFILEAINPRRNYKRK